MSKAFPFIALIAIATLGISCSSTTTTPPVSPTVVVPTAGTTWTFKNVLRDTNGVITRTDTSIQTVVRTGKTYNGFSDVVMLVEAYPTRTITSDTSYVRFLSNGDISRVITNPITNLSLWLIEPYYTHNSSVLTFDSNVVSTRGPELHSIRITNLSVAPEVDSVKGVALDARVIYVITQERIFYPGTDSTILIRQANSLIPAKGIFGNHQVISHSIKEKHISLEESTLIDYSSK